MIIAIFFKITPNLVFVIHYSTLKKLFGGGGFNFSQEIVFKTLTTYSIGKSLNYFYFIQDVSNMLYEATYSTFQTIYWGRKKKFAFFHLLFFSLKENLNILIVFYTNDLSNAVKLKRILIQNGKLILNGMSESQFANIYRKVLKNHLIALNTEGLVINNYKRLLNQFCAIRLNGINHLANIFSDKNYMRFDPFYISLSQHFSSSKRLIFTDPQSIQIPGIKFEYPGAYKSSYLYNF
jgi:hypothetical protein